MATSLNRSLVDDIVQRIVQVAKPERIILFGSHAGGDAAEDSDIDLLVVMREVTSRRDEVMRIRDVLVPLRISVDVLVTSEAGYEKWSQAPSTTRWNAA